MLLQQTVSAGNSFMATLERERQIIFSTDISVTERHPQWSQRKAEIEAYLAAHDPAPTFHDHVEHGRSLVKTSPHHIKV
jgi:hypothetical protein